MSSKLTPFSSKGKELARNLSLVSDKVDNCFNILSRLNEFLVDLVVLADELDLDENEKAKIEDLVARGMNRLQDIQKGLKDTSQSVRLFSKEMTGPDGLGEFFGRKVTNPFKPVFSKQAHVKRSELKDKLIRLGYKKPELRDELRPILRFLDSSKYHQV